MRLKIVFTNLLSDDCKVLFFLKAALLLVASKITR
jgi:hypothetical protein